VSDNNTSTETATMGAARAMLTFDSYVALSLHANQLNDAPVRCPPTGSTIYQPLKFPIWPNPRRTPGKLPKTSILFRID